VADPRGLKIARALLAKCDVVAEGFSPGVLERWGLGYDEQRKIRPDVIYVNQSGMGAFGTYGPFRAVGPIAAALSGMSLDALLGAWTRSFEPYQLMARLQSAGVPAGVCQTAGDRCDNDPQLRHLGWLTELTGTRIGRWPLAEVPVRMSRTPPYLGGRPDRAAPLYGEDNAAILTGLLGMSEDEVASLAEEGVL
jgi:crotonobetainyl-CoA:carnitine CoA-transferase CaiB-like acyl-CoA transferase